MRKKYEMGIEGLKDIEDISKLYTLDKNLYYRVLRRAKARGMSVFEYLADLGYDYIINRKKVKTIDEKSIVAELNEKYPNMKVEKLSKDKRLYKLISNRAKADNITVENWLKTRGFEYIKSTKGYVLSDFDIKLLLWEMYPDGEIISLSSNDRVLYQRIKRRTDNIKKYCEDLGFKYLSR